jgi:hypothetical protein
MTVKHVLAPIITIRRQVLHEVREGYLRSESTKFNLDWDGLLVEEDFHEVEMRSSHFFNAFYHHH